MPLINDVTTTPDAPPALDSPYPPRFRFLQRWLYPGLHPLTFAIPTADLFTLIEGLAMTRPDWSVTTRTPRRLEIVATTSVLGFKDDVAIEVRDAPEGSSVHMRSRSRVGLSDFGANARRIRQFLNALEQVCPPGPGTKHTPR